MSRDEETRWESLYRAGVVPRSSVLLRPCGVSEWRVDVRTGLVPSMGGWPLRHRKRLSDPECSTSTPGNPRPRPVGSVGGVAHESSSHHTRLLGYYLIGENVLRRDLRWGRFEVKLVRSELDFRPSLLLNYDVPANGWFGRQIKDHVRTTSDPRLLVGRMYFRGRFLGYFTMTRGGDLDA
jgi:hypothetical protein